MIPLIGYANRLSARPGDEITFHVHSARKADFQAQLIRITSADPNPEGPGIVTTALNAGFNGSYPSKPQAPNLGSYIEVDAATGPSQLQAFTVIATIWPTLRAPREQTILSTKGNAQDGGFRIFLNEDGAVTLSINAESDGVLSLSTGEALHLRRWYRVWAHYDPVSGMAKVGHFALEGTEEAESKTFGGHNGQKVALAQIRIGAACGSTPHAFFNGKIEAPAIFQSLLEADEIKTLGAAASRDDTVAAWDFSAAISSMSVTDRGPNQLHGSLVNLPLRAMKGAAWNGDEMCWRHAPEQYGAIHFHEDDFYDCGWDVAFRFTIPFDMRSGIYAAKLTCEELEDTIPFFVAPPLGQATASVCLVIPTFTYVVYGNHWRPEAGPDLKQRMADWGAYPWNPVDHREYGLSAYNFHSDGSGVAMISSRRPLMTLKVGYVTLLLPRGGSGLRHFQADTHIVTWLEQMGIAYDIVTDEELHRDGVAALAPYKAVLTASHPEYHTVESLNAFRDYRDSGGHLAYLGGNGFYWRVAVHPDLPGAVEIRRGEGGIRAWAAEPGEYYHAFDGQYGGLWRRNGRPPQQLAGVGFSSQGKFEGSYYRRTAASYDPDFAWMFAGIDGETLGDFGLSGCGAAGYELDRADPMLGSPDNLVVLAQSENHADHYVVVPEELLTHVSTVTGEPPEALIRADLSWFDTPSGGAVFATGSITFCGSLPYNGGDNEISCLLLNVINRFLN